MIINNYTADIDDIQKAKAAKVKAGPEKQVIPVNRPTEEEVLLISPSAVGKTKKFRKLLRRDL
jgi:hypothetical protein